MIRSDRLISFELSCLEKVTRKIDCVQISTFCAHSSTTMHSSWMRTVRCSSRLLVGGEGGEGVCPEGGVCPGGVSQYALRQTPPCGQNSRHTLLKNYLAATSLRTVIINSYINTRHFNESSLYPTFQRI